MLWTYLGATLILLVIARLASGLVVRLLQYRADARRQGPPLPVHGLSLPLAQHDPPHRAAADALDAGEQLRLPCPAAAAVVAHLRKDGRGSACWAARSAPR